MSFDQQQFETSLNTKQFGRPCYFFDVLPSTNDTLWDLIDQGASSGTAVIAAQQQSGRGQWGRQWQSPPGGLYLSVALIFDQLAANKGTELMQWSAWGIATILRAHSIPVWLKWPNDILLYGRKLGGILTETRLHQGQITVAVIGVGLNWANSVPECGINLQATAQPHPSVHSLEGLAAITLEGLEQGYQHWQTSGIKSLLPDYLALLQLGDRNAAENIGGQGNRVVG